MKQVISTLSFFILFVACSANMQTHQIADVSRKQTIVLNNESADKNVHALTIYCEGKINGKASLALILNGKEYKAESLSGNVQFKWGGDWYSDSAELTYNPEPGISGTLTLKYKFETI